MKRCTKCKSQFPLVRFKLDKTRKDGRSSWCKRCHSKQTLIYQQRSENTAKVSKNKNKYRLKMYGLNEDSYNALLKNQDYKCKICGKKNDNDKTLSIDHCHETGRVRGLLCIRCNSGIGFLKDNPSLAAEALFYLLETEPKNNLKAQVVGYVLGRMTPYRATYLS